MCEQVRQEEEKAEVVEYEQLQNELLMKDMELRQSYVKESMMNEGATLRSTPPLMPLFRMRLFRLSWVLLDLEDDSTLALPRFP